MAQGHVLRPRVKEQAIAGAKNCLSFTSRIPGNADAGREVLVVGLVKIRKPARCDLDQISSCRGGRNEIRKKMVLLNNGSGIVPPQAIIQSDSRREAEIVLSVETNA